MLDDSSGQNEYARRALRRQQNEARRRGYYPGKPRKHKPTPATFTSSAADGRDPQGVAAVIGRLRADMGWWNDGLDMGRIFENWEGVVGTNFAAHCTPVTFEDGELTVQADSTAWAASVRSISSRVLATINAEIGRELVLELHVRGPATVSWVRGKRTVKGWRGVRDTYG